MPIPLFRCLSRPLTHFLHRNWLLLTPLSSADPCVETSLTGPRKKKTPIPYPRPTVERLEDRLTPQDMFGVLKSGISVIGVTLIGGQFITPLHAFLSGWNDGQFAVPQSPPDTNPSTAIRPDFPELAPSQLAAEFFREYAFSRSKRNCKL